MKTFAPSEAGFLFAPRRLPLGLGLPAALASSNCSDLGGSTPDLRKVLRFAQRRAKGAPCSKDRIPRQPAPVRRQISLTPKSGCGKPAQRFLLPAMGLVSEKLASQAD